MGLAEVSTVLWRERELLDLLLYKLESEQLMLAAGRTRWLARATREVETVLEEIKRVELTRAVEVASVAPGLGLPPDATLSQLAAAAPAPWDGLLAGHRAAFLAVTAEVDAVAAANRELLQRGYRAAAETLGTVLGVQRQGYDAGGRPTVSVGRRHLVDGTV